MVWVIPWEQQRPVHPPTVSFHVSLPDQSAVMNQISSHRRFRDNIGESLHHVLFVGISSGAVGDVVSTWDDALLPVYPYLSTRILARVLISSMASVEFSAMPKQLH
jgi:hypothetical protein